MSDKELINSWIQSCNFYIRQVKSCSDLIHDWFEYELFDMFTDLRNLFLKLSNQNKNKNLKSDKNTIWK